VVIRPSAIGRARDMESSLAKDRRSAAVPPATHIISKRNVVFHKNNIQ